jgi:anti-sigma factor RsiW
MLHTQIENEDILERYTRNQLELDDRQAFEEHLLTCDECFEKLQAMDRFTAGMREAADQGLLRAVERRNWFPWALAATTAGALILAALTAWLYFYRLPQLRADLKRSDAELQEERRVRSALEQKTPPQEVAEANIPLVMLQSSRSADEPAALVLQPAAKHVVLWIELTPPRYNEFRLEVFAQDRRLVTTVDHLTRGPYGGIAVSLPSDQLPAGDFRITLSGQNPPPVSLIGDYHLRVRRSQ